MAYHTIKIDTQTLSELEELRKRLMAKAKAATPGGPLPFVSKSAVIRQALAQLKKGLRS